MTTHEVADAKAPAEIDVADFSNLIANMSRLLTGLVRIQPFSDANLGLAEWLALAVLAEKDGVSNKHLGRALGVTGQRANQITTSLTKAGLISVNQSAEDSRRNEIMISDAGKAQVNAINSQLKPLLSSALKGRERSLASAAKQLRHMMRIVQAGTPDTQGKDKPGKKVRKADKAARADDAA